MLRIPLKHLYDFIRIQARSQRHLPGKRGVQEIAGRVGVAIDQESNASLASQSNDVPVSIAMALTATDLDEDTVGSCRFCLFPGQDPRMGENVDVRAFDRGQVGSGLDRLDDRLAMHYYNSGSQLPCLSCDLRDSTGRHVGEFDAG